MIDTKQNRDLIIVACDGEDCRSVIRLYASCIHTVQEAIDDRGWGVKGSMAIGTDTHYCRACTKKQGMEESK